MRFVISTNADRLIHRAGKSNEKKWGKMLVMYGRCAIYERYMKMTMYIDDDLLARVMEATGAETKTKAIDLALREMDRRARLVKMANAGLGMNALELKDAVDPAYSLENMRRMEGPVNYGRKSRTR
jgi:Arc/MetJ family transcription regulator